MRSLLIRLYPAVWRARYGDEFEALLDERPLGPFDVADILLGAVDARLRLRSVRSDIQHGKGISMTLRIGGLASILGGALLTISIVLGTGLVGNVDPALAGGLLITGSAALLVGLVGLSAFQARVHPVLSWTAVAVTGVGLLASILGVVGMQLVGEGFWMAFILGLMGAFVGSTLFAIATYRTAALSRPAALLLGVASVLTVVAGFAGNTLGPVPMILSVGGFVAGWVLLGVHALRLDRPPASPQPA